MTEPEVVPVMGAVSVPVAESIVIGGMVAVAVVMEIGWRLAYRGRGSGATRKKQTNGQ